MRRSARLERLLARVPRYLFSGLVVVLSLLGVRELVFAAQSQAPGAAGPVADVAAEDFAQRFARAYLTYDVSRPAARERALGELVPDELPGDAGLALRGSQEVLWTEVAQNQEAIAGGRVIVVEAGVSTQEAALYLAVPVGRDAAGALELTGYPSLVGPPIVGRGERPEREEIEDGEILAVARRVVANYLAGERVNLAADLAQAQKPDGGGGNSAERAGNNLAELISDNVGPVLIVLVGVSGLLAFTQRSIGMAVTAVIVGLFAGLFVIEPDSAEGLFKDVYRAIF